MMGDHLFNGRLSGKQEYDWVGSRDFGGVKRGVGWVEPKVLYTKRLNNKIPYFSLFSHALKVIAVSALFDFDDCNITHVDKITIFTHCFSRVWHAQVPILKIRNFFTFRILSHFSRFPIQIKLRNKLNLIDHEKFMFQH